MWKIASYSRAMRFVVILFDDAVRVEPTALLPLSVFAVQVDRTRRNDIPPVRQISRGCGQTLSHIRYFNMYVALSKGDKRAPLFF